jgi:hypothetical protein
MIRHAMNPPAVAIAAFLALVSAGFAEEKKPAENKLKLGVWHLEPALVLAADPSQKEGGRKPLPGFKLEEKEFPAHYDATEFLESNGVLCPPGSEAIYDPDSSALVVRNTQENLDLLDMLLSGCCDMPLVNISFEISVYECRLPGDSGTDSKKWPVYHDLQKLPKGELVLLGRVSALTKSAERIDMSQVELPAAVTASSRPADPQKQTDPAHSFQPGESGIKAEVEAILGADGLTFDNTIAFHYRDARQKPVSQLDFMTSYTGWDGYPIIIHVSPSPGAPDKSLVVVANATVVNQGGWRIRDLAIPAETKPKP